MTVFRLQKKKYGSDISGIGATLVAGRWNLKGDMPMLYTTTNVSLSLLEVLVHLPKSGVKPDLVLLKIEIPDDEIEVMGDSILPNGWNDLPYSIDVQRWGSNWLASLRSLAISVPSAITSDRNVLINPMHANFGSIKVVAVLDPFLFDSRLL
jgi:RES domain-containing protein